MDQETNNVTNRNLGYKITIIILSVLLLCAIFAALFVANWTISINADNVPSVIKLGEKVELPTATVNGRIFNKSGFTVPVSVNVTLDPNKIGNQIQTYSAKWLFYNTEITKTIFVIDDTKPIITLVEKDNHITPPGKEYEEEGYSATDNYDGDITNNVKVFINGDIVTYLVSDSSGNITITERTIDRGDTVAPKIELIGAKEITINQGAQYHESGAKAQDDVDGDITNNIKTDSNLNINEIGTYQIKYTVKDAANNIAEVIRTVYVVAAPETQYEPSEIGKGRVIHLTFDDGPTKHTKELLRVLEKYNVKATFFVVGNTGYTDYIKDIVDAGHSIGMHSVNHKYGDIYANEEAFFQDLYKMQTIIKEKSEVETFLMRFPGGSSNTVSKSYNKGIMTRLCQQVQDKGFVYFDWNVSSGDAGGATTAEQVFNNVVDGLKKHKTSVVLQHDTKEFSVNAVEEIIKWALANGYSFAPLDMNSFTAHHTPNN